MIQLIISHTFRLQKYHLVAPHVLACHILETVFGEDLSYQNLSGMVVLIAGSVPDFLRHFTYRHVLETLETFRFAEVRQYHFLFGSLEEERLVVELYLIVLVGFEPVAVTTVQQMLDLGIKLWIVDIKAVDLFNFVAEETAVAGGVVQHLRIVAGAGKGSPVRQVLGMAGIRQADADELPGDEVLQQT